MSKGIVQPQSYLSWMEGKLVFLNDTIDVIARRLKRWYKVDVEMGGNYFESVRFRATFVDEKLEGVLYFLKRALPVDYKIITGKYRADDEIYSKKKIMITMKK